MRVTLFIPVLNEIQGLRLIMPQIRREWVDEIVIVDGHSTDGSREYLEEQGHTVLAQEKPGIFSAWWQGFEAATGDVIICFSPDNNSLPEAIPQLVAKMREGYDLAVASRYKGAARSHDDTLLTAAGNYMYTRIINRLFRGSYTDALGMYRAFRKSLLHELKLDEHKADIFEVLMAIRAVKAGKKIVEIEAEEPRRIDGRVSRAWPGLYGRLRGGTLMTRLILREWLAR
jgi:glycosyltransferase involved in cell wall biosynthesis